MKHPKKTNQTLEKKKDWKTKYINIKSKLILIELSVIEKENGLYQVKTKTA